VIVFEDVDVLSVNQLCRCSAGRVDDAGPTACAMIESGLRSGEVADAAGVNVQTLRYYERRGLLHEPDRTLGGHRVYPPATVTVLRVTKAAQRLVSRWTRSRTCWRSATFAPASGLMQGCRPARG
jgi:MerR family regulatory protein